MKNKYKIVKDITQASKTTKTMSEYDPVFNRIHKVHLHVLNKLNDQRIPVIRVTDAFIEARAEDVAKLSSSNAFNPVPPYETFWVEKIAKDGIPDLILVETTRIDKTSDFIWSFLVVSQASDTKKYNIMVAKFSDCVPFKDGTFKGISKPLIPQSYNGQIADTTVSEHEESVKGYAGRAIVLCNILSVNNVILVEELADGVIRTGKKGKRKKTKVPYITIAVSLTEKQQKRLNTANPYITFEDMERRGISQRRGCLRDYTKGNGLFGKYHGIYYWNPILMNSKAKTSIVKEVADAKT